MEKSKPEQSTIRDPNTGKLVHSVDEFEKPEQPTASAVGDGKTKEKTK